MNSQSLPSNNATDRATKIANIIKQRQELIEKIEVSERNLGTLLLSMGELERHREKLLPQIKETSDSSTLKQIDLHNLIQKIEVEYKKITNLKERFSRSTLNIGVIGRTGAGKSTLLQSLSGLPDDLIPAREGKPCTAARSMIYHQPQGDTKFIVYFHTEKTFLEQVIIPYYQKLELSNPPARLEDFAKAKFQPNQYDRGPTKNTMYSRFYNDYYCSYYGYKELLGKAPLEIKYPLNIKDEIWKYVAQERNENDKLKSLEHLAVQKVEIFCTFPKYDVGQIALVDIPGLGDFKLADETLMLETLSQEVDVVLFVKKPGNHRYAWEVEDTNLYDKAKKALSDLPDRAFMVLNLDGSENNQNGCKQLKADVDRENVKMEFAGECIIAECITDPTDPTKKDAVNNKILEPVLNYLESKIKDLDIKYSCTCNGAIIDLHGLVKTKLDEASNACRHFGDEYGQFRVYFDGKDERSGLWIELVSGLGQLLDNLRLKRDQEDPKFKEMVKQTIERCKSESEIPSVEEIENQRHDKGGLPKIYNEYIEEIRARISNHFISLDWNLQESLEIVKTSVKEVLVNQGKLKNFSNAEGSAFFREIESKLRELNKDNLSGGFHYIGEFNLSFAGTIQCLIRPHLEVLVPKINIAGTNQDLNKSLDIDTSQSVQEKLKKLQAQVVTACETELNKLFSKPNQVAYYMVEEFRDRVLRAKGVKHEWDTFLWEKRQDVWPEFKTLGERMKVKQEWENSIEKVKLANQLHLLRFLN